MAYCNSPRDNPRDAVRLLVGDISTSTSAEFLSDVDYDYFLSRSGNNYIAGSLAANSLAALFAGAAASGSGDGFSEKTVGDLTIRKSDATQIAAGYKGMAASLRRMAAAGVAPYAGGISDSDKRSVEGNADRVRPAFLRGLFDNPQTLDAVGGAGSLSS